MTFTYAWTKYRNFSPSLVVHYGEIYSEKENSPIIIDRSQLLLPVFRENSCFRMAAVGVGGTVDGVRVVEFKDLDPSVQELITAAIDVRKVAYCPYSNFAVGAAVRTTNGDLFTGCNIENAAFGPTVCAERTAIFKAVSEGQKEFAACAIVAYQENSFTAPCGICRQVLSEFAKRDFPVYLAKPAPCRVLCTSVYELLPHRFTGLD